MVEGTIVEAQDPSGQEDPILKVVLGEDVARLTGLGVGDRVVMRGFTSLPDVFELVEVSGIAPADRRHGPAVGQHFARRPRAPRPDHVRHLVAAVRPRRLDDRSVAARRAWAQAGADGADVHAQPRPRGGRARKRRGPRLRCHLVHPTGRPGGGHPDHHPAAGPRRGVRRAVGRVWGSDPGDARPHRLGRPLLPHLHGRSRPTFVAENNALLTLGI